MTIADKMTDAVIEYLDELHVMIFDEDMAELRGELKLLIQRVADRGREEACKFLTTEEYETIDAIMANEWEEEQT